MTPFSAYCRYVAIKNHFTNRTYDCHKYNFKVRASKPAFEKRNDKMFFYKIVKHPDLDGLLVSLFIRNPEVWIGDIVHGYAEAEELYREWKKRTQSLRYTFIEDLKKMDIKTDLKTPSNQYPPALLRMLRGEISVETVLILTEITGALDRWSKKLSGDIIYDRYELILKKYRSFLSYDKKEFKILLRNHLEEIVK